VVGASQRLDSLHVDSRIMANRVMSTNLVELHQLILALNGIIAFRTKLNCGILVYKNGWAGMFM
jgi:hypothetical protein